MREPIAILEEEVRELVRRTGIDPSQDPAEVERLVDAALDDYGRRVLTANLPRVDDEGRVRKALFDRVAGFGPIQPLLDDPTIEEIWINAPGKVFYAAQGKHVLTNVVIGSRQLRDLVERMLRSSGRRLDLSSPFVDATLPDGSRLHVAIPAITRKHWAVNIRKFILRAHDFDELIRLGSLGESAAGFLDASVKAGLNIVVSGGTQSGKTTVLNCLSACIPARERIITCEEVFELQIRAPDVVALQTRPPSMEGTGEIDLRRLIVEALRMRPDRIIVGEVRQKEAFDLLVALNSGLPGMTSIHANNAREAITKLVTLPLLAGGNVSHGFILPTVASTIDLIVHLSKETSRRETKQIVAVTGRVEGDQLETVSLFERQHGDLRWTGMQPPKSERFAKAGIDVRKLLT